MAENDPPRGRAIRLLQPIGRGGFGTVFLAEVRGAEGLVQRLAVKLLHERWATDTDIAARARDEARLMSQLNHDNVVRIHGLTHIGGRSAVLMEYVEGVDAGTLTQAGEPGQGLPLRVVAQIGEQVASALDAAWHTLSPVSGEPLRVVHRDIKPPNVLVSAGGAVKVMDFGIARGEVEREAHTQSAQFGTGRYMAPERWLYGEAGAESDLFSLGVTLWELCTARPMERLPLERVAFEEALGARLADLAGTLGAEGPRMAELLRDTLAFEPRDRTSAAALVEALSALGDDVKGPSLRRFARQQVPGLREARLEHMASDPDAGNLTGTVYTGIARGSNETFAGAYLPEETSPEPGSHLGGARPLSGDTFGIATGTLDLDVHGPRRSRAAVVGAVIALLTVGPAALWWQGQQDTASPVQARRIAVPAPPPPQAVPAPEERTETETETEPAAEPQQKPPSRSPVPRTGSRQTRQPEPEPEPEQKLIEVPGPTTAEGAPSDDHEPHVVVIDEREEQEPAPPPAPAPVVETTVKILADPREGTLTLGSRHARVGDSLTVPVGTYTARFEGPGWHTTCQVVLTQSTTRIKFVEKGARCLSQ